MPTFVRFALLVALSGFNVQAMAQVGTAPAGSHSGIRAAEIDGVRLGMGVNEAVSALQERGFKLDGCESDTSGRCSDPKLGTTIGGKIPRSATGEQVVIRHMDGVVYYYNKTLQYYQGKSIPEGHTVESLKQEIYDKYSALFQARYSDEVQPGDHQFDDETPPPYNRKVDTPHASLGFSGRRGALSVGITMHWKNLVGASW